MKLAVTYENGQVFQHFGHCRQFKLYTVEDGEKGSEILAIRASSSISPGESNFDLLTTAGNIYYEVRIAQDEPYDLNVQRVQYMFTVLSD